MARLSRIFWLALLVGAAYVAWRWRTRQNVPTLAPPPPPAPPPSPAPAMRADASGTPRRIPTRVHRGAPPSMAERAQQVAEQAQERAAELAGQVREAVAEAVEQVQERAVEAADQVAAGVEQAQERAAELAGQAREAGAEAVDQLTTTADQASETASEVGSSRAVGDGGEAERTLAAPLGDTPDVPAEPVNVNTADLETLIALPGIGAVLAQRIVRYRTDNGAFHSIEELIEVPGIGARNLETFRHLITV